MSRPIPKDQITVDDAVRLIIQIRMAKQHEEIQDKFSFERLDWELQQPLDVDVDSVPFEFSQELINSLGKLWDEARLLLRQWLRDGEIRAYYCDALSKDSVQIMPPAWGLALTDRAINGGEFNMHEDPRLAGPAGLLRSDLERVIGREGISVAQLPLHQETCQAASADSSVMVSAGLLQRPTGRDRKSAGARIALQELYGSEMGREVRPKERATAVVNWLRKRQWSYPTNAKTIYDILNPDKR